MNAYVELRRAWSTYDYFADKSLTERASFVVSLLLALGFFAATAGEDGGGGRGEGGASYERNNMEVDRKCKAKLRIDDRRELHETPTTQARHVVLAGKLAWNCTTQARLVVDSGNFMETKFLFRNRSRSAVRAAR